MEDIFAKLDLIEKLISDKPVKEIWKQLSQDEYQNKVTNEKLSRIEFVKLQDKIGASAFIIEVLR